MIPGDMMASERETVILTGNDALALDRFLLPRAESSLVLLANARAAGLDYRGMALQGTYAAYRTRDGITGVAAHYWNGMVILQAPENAGELLRAVLAASGRACTGIAGPGEQVQEVLPAILATAPRPAMNSRDTLFSLDLDDLITPGTLQRGDPACRHPRGDELSDVAAMRIASLQEHLTGDTDASGLAGTGDLVRTQQDAGNLWVLESGGRIVATAAFSAAIPGVVQLGGVYTIPGYRNRGYGRAVVAGSLLEAKTRGVRKAILFTGTEMHAAQRMYRALGFRPIGEYGLVIF
jgi:GNAT superfamily N-acetyltransferase